MVFIFGLKEMIFESKLIDPRIQTDIVVVSIVATIFTVVLIAGIIKVSFKNDNKISTLYTKKFAVTNNSCFKFTFCLAKQQQ